MQARGGTHHGQHGVIGVAFAFLIHDEDAAATMRQGAPAAGERVAAAGD